MTHDEHGGDPGRSRAPGQAVDEPPRQGGSECEERERDGVMGGGVQAEELEPRGVEHDRQRPIELDLDTGEIPGAVKRREDFCEGIGAQEMVVVVVEAVVQSLAMDQPGGGRPASTITTSAANERLAQDLLGNRLELQVGGSLVDLADFCVAEQLLDRVLLDEPVAAEQVDRE